MLNLLLPIIGNVLDRVLPGETESERVKKLEIQNELIKSVTESAEGNLQVNKAEAETGNLFLAGWRPAIGWACAAGFIYTVFVQPIGSWLCGLYGVPGLPVLDPELFTSVMLGMLGLGGFRSYEKMKGIK